nr:MAG TPA: hypothetical protein [Bacteriophage sp.]
MGDFLKNCTLWVLTQILRFKSAGRNEILCAGYNTVLCSCLVFLHFLI